jgi:hypothetical protein
MPMPRQLVELELQLPLRIQGATAATLLGLALIFLQGCYSTQRPHLPVLNGPKLFGWPHDPPYHVIKDISAKNCDYFDADATPELSIEAKKAGGDAIADEYCSAAMWFGRCEVCNGKAVKLDDPLPKSN